jgi:primary-amine oxidase
MIPTRPDVHVLDPLSPAEIERAAELVRDGGRFGTGSRFILISTAEPPHGSAERQGRAAEVIAFDPERQVVSEFRVDLERDAVIAVTERDDVRPAIGLAEVEGFEQAVRGHAGFREALRRRGIDDLERVIIDPAPAGSYGTPEEAARGRLARLLVYVRPSDGGNAYARPVEGVHGLVDLDTGVMVHFEDRGIVPFPAEEGEFREQHVAPRDGARPIHISQPEGPSFDVDGYQVRWQKWRLRVGFSSREGLVLHEVGYEDGGVERPILRRASFAEMVVPYAHPDRFFQTPLDIGELNLGTMTNSLTLGCDCLGVIQYFDVAYADRDGRAVSIPQAVCLHEEDDGIAWKHTDFRTGHVEVRRGRRLVVSSIVTVGNYEYGFFWYFRQDGSIEAEVKATGIVLTEAVEGDGSPVYSKLIAPGLAAYHHQHIFCARLDFALDGGGNSVVEVHTEGLPPGPDNPHGNAWVTRSRPLAREQDARRDIDIATARGWVVVNPKRRNAVGQPVGYRLIPGENAKPFSAAGASARRRAAFMDHHLWVTPYALDERYPAGEYPYQHAGGDGLPRWVEANRSIEDTDLVVWYTINHHHVPRPEDWPVMPVARMGFQLRPWGFFDRSPALDVAPTVPGEGSCHACHAPGHR